MGFFDIFKRKSAPVELPEEEQKWNRMWFLWEKGLIRAPYAELMEYESEVNNGGHSQYFFNTSNNGTVEESVGVLLGALPRLLADNLEKAYATYCAQEAMCDEEAEAVFDACDDFFYEHEDLLLNMLHGYAERMNQ